MRASFSPRQWARSTFPHECRAYALFCRIAFYTGQTGCRETVLDAEIARDQVSARPSHLRLTVKSTAVDPTQT